MIVISSTRYRIRLIDLQLFLTPTPEGGVFSYECYMKRKMHAGAAKEIYQRARELRNQPTHAEDILWGYLKTKPHNIKFRRQHPYSIFIPDFYCHSLKLVIEVDGSIHNSNEVKVNDQQRQALLEADGLVFLRFSNDEIINGLENVIQTIEKFILTNPHKVEATVRNASPLGAGGIP